MSERRCRQRGSTVEAGSRFRPACGSPIDGAHARLQLVIGLSVAVLIVVVLSAYGQSQVR